MLKLAGREADIVGFVPQTLPGGGHDWLDSTPELLAKQVAFRAIITDRPDTAAAELAPAYDLTPSQVLASPEFLIGSADDVVERLQERRERFGISYLEIDDRDAAGFAPVVARLSGT